MNYYIGLDISMKETAVCVMNDDLQFIHESTVKTDPSAIYKKIDGLNIENLKMVGLESGTYSHWLTRELRLKGLPVTCYDARSVAKITELNINKTDKNDARSIAIGIRSGICKICVVKTPEQLSQAGVIRIRSQLVKQRVELKNCIRGLFKPAGINLPTSEGKSFIKSVELQLPALPDPIAKAIQTTLKTFISIHEAVLEIDAQTKNLVKDNPQASLLMSIDGVGAITALSFLAEVGDPKRFKNTKSIGAYIGLTPTQYSSGETEKYGRISKRGPSMLRGLLSNCALVLLTRTQKWSKLKAWGMRVKNKKGIQKAIIAVARKLAVLMLKMLLDNTYFIPGGVLKEAA